ncbi:MAG TPA: phosphoribosylamine--glycine ligase [Bacillales bacterium]|nr:phosphoribosylamine--glycine ligase [Bacillales bacterium]
MNVLVVGRGGREHAIAWKIAQSKRIGKLFVAPGNDGMKAVARCIGIDENDHAGLIAFAQEENVDLTIIGPEQPLAAGIVNKFQDAGLTVFGPTKEAALVESSKSFAKQLMQTYGIPTAASRTFISSAEAKEYVKDKGAPIVIKADGLAAGKGVTVAATEKEALHSLEDILENGKFADAGAKVVIEDYLEGEEFSLMAFVNGETVCPMVASQDHKPVFDGDRGPNTGGMGAYSPVPQLPGEVVRQSVDTILRPAARALVKENRPFTGILYAGLIQTAGGPRVIEFNARFGDPETQVILPRLNTDLVEVILSVLDGGTPALEWSEEAYVGVVLASGGYPGSYQKGVPLGGLDTLDDETLVFHAGTKQQDGRWLSNGGRILLLARGGGTVKQAQDRVYRDMGKLVCRGAFYRKDIADKAVLKQRME